jgi:hypothetical protein
MEDKTTEEQAEIILQLEIDLSDVKDYICWYNNKGVLVAELNKDLVGDWNELLGSEADDPAGYYVNEPPTEETENGGFTDDTEDLTVIGFTNEE